jgi:sigma-E factor negative regulatory protein RseC
MEKEQEGLVVETEGNIAHIQAIRHSSCESCGACPGNKAMVVKARNPVGAKRGQRVAFEIEQVSMLKSAVIVYATPLLSTIIGVICGYYTGDALGFENPIWFQTAGGIIGFILSVVYVRYYDRKARTMAEMQPVIIRIL